MTYIDANRFLAGLVIGIALAAGWVYLRYKRVFLDLISDREGEDEEDQGEVRGPVTLEHYHWGLIIFTSSLAFKYPGFGLIDGIAIALVFAETLQKHPFGIGKSHFLASTLFGALLVIILLMAYPL